MLQTVDVGKRSLAAYRGVAPDTILDDLTRLAEIFRGARVVHINATPYGGGVSELLRSVVPLMNDLGILTDWKILSGDDPFFQVTKKIHNGMQGAPEELTTKSARPTLRMRRRTRVSSRSGMILSSFTIRSPPGCSLFEGRATPDGSGDAISTPRIRTGRFGIS